MQYTSPFNTVAFVLALGLTGNLDAADARVETLVEGTPLHGIQGLTWGHDGNLYAAAVSAQTLSRIDPQTGEVETLVGAPLGESDDVDLGPDGTLVWTAMVAGELRMKRPGGEVETLASDLPGLNPVAFSPDGRLFAVTMGDPSRLWEFFLDRPNERRLVSDTIGILNSFDFAPDGTLYGPYWRSGMLAKINVDTGEEKTVAQNLGSPTAVEIDSQGYLISVDYRTGEVRRTDPLSGLSQVFAVLPAPLDNLAIGPDDTIYVSDSARSGIFVVRPNGTIANRLTGGEFSTPGGLDVVTIDGQEKIVVADSTGYRFVDPATGEIDRPPYNLRFGTSINIASSDRYLALTDARMGRAHVIDIATREVVRDQFGFKTPYGVAFAGDAVLIAEYASGTLLRWTEDGSTVIADGLDTPVGLALETETSVLITENGPGTVKRINLADGTQTEIYNGLVEPEGLAVMADGRIAVAEVGAARIVAVDLATGTAEVLADNLNFGVAAVRAPIEVGLPTGLAVGSDGTIYFSEDGANAIKVIRFD